MVKCEECGKDIMSFYEMDGHKLCLGCYSDLKDSDKNVGERKKETEPAKLERKKCKNCGIQLGFRTGQGYHVMEDGSYLCYSCYDKLSHRETLTPDRVAELTERELLSQLIKEIRVMREDLSTVRQIIVFWFIIGLIGFVLSIISVLALL